MTPKKAAVLILLVSLVFGLAILIASNLLSGTEHRMTVIYWLFAIWWIPFSILCGCGASNYQLQKK